MYNSWKTFFLWWWVSWRDHLIDKATLDNEVFLKLSVALEIHICVLNLHTVLYTFPKVLTGRIVEQSRPTLVSDHFLYYHDLRV